MLAYCDAEGSRVENELMQQNQPRLGVCTYLTVLSCTYPSYIHLTDTLLRSMSNGWFVYRNSTFDSCAMGCFEGVDLYESFNFLTKKIIFELLELFTFFHHYFTIGA